MKRQIMIAAAVALVLCQPIIACQFPDPGDNCPGGSTQKPTKDNGCREVFYMPSGPSQWCVTIPEWGYTDCTPYIAPVVKVTIDLAWTFDSNGYHVGCSYIGANPHPPENVGTCEYDYVPNSADYCGD